MTRNIQLSFQRSDQDSLLFLVTFYNYRARSKVDEAKIKQKEEKQNSDKKYSAVLSEQTQSHQKKEKEEKNNIGTRNIQLSLQKSDQACLLFLVTFYNYPARS